MIYVLYVFASIGILFLLNKLTKFVHNFKEHYEYLKELKLTHWDRSHKLSEIEWNGKHLKNDFDRHMQNSHSDAKCCDVQVSSTIPVKKVIGRK